MNGALQTRLPASGIARVLNLETPDRSESSPRLYPADGQPGGRALFGLQRDRLFISLRSELAGDPAQDFTKRHPRLGFDWLRHGPTMEQSDVELVAPAYVKARR